ncbi:hypothetical protein [Brevundimonas sp. SL130]|nr:hypothetical protein [Brevundimonas sp. SL130]WAC60333.1 hypothetical protein OU998_02485 [Brevundimonas sp. SL130]
MKAVILALVLATASPVAALASEASKDPPLKLNPLLIEGDEGATLEHGSL